MRACCACVRGVVRTPSGHAHEAARRSRSPAVLRCSMTNHNPLVHIRDSRFGTTRTQQHAQGPGVTTLTSSLRFGRRSNDAHGSRARASPLSSALRRASLRCRPGLLRLALPGRSSWVAVSWTAVARSTPVWSATRKHAVGELAEARCPLRPGPERPASTLRARRSPLPSASRAGSAARAAGWGPSRADPRCRRCVQRLSCNSVTPREPTQARVAVGLDRRERWAATGAVARGRGRCRPRRRGPSARPWPVPGHEVVAAECGLRPVGAPCAETLLPGAAILPLDEVVAGGRAGTARPCPTTSCVRWCRAWPRPTCGVPGQLVVHTRRGPRASACSTRRRRAACSPSPCIPVMTFAGRPEDLDRLERCRVRRDRPGRAAGGRRVARARDGR